MPKTETKRRARRRRPTKAKRRLYKIALALAALLLIACGVTLVAEMIEIKGQEDVRKLYHGDARSWRFSLIASAAAEEEAPVQADFEQLLALNADVIGWITAGEELDGPVLYRDNEYYMNHNIYGRFSQHGEIFADEENLDCRTDPFVILYGHNKRNGTVFGSLKHYRDLAYLQQNPTVAFRTLRDEEPVTFVPFAVFDASMSKTNADYFHLRRFDLFSGSNAAQAQAYLDETKARSLMEIPVEVTPEDRILALVTCSYDDYNGRLLLFCRAQRAGEELSDLEAAVAASSAR